VRRFSSRPSEPADGGEEPYSRRATNPGRGIAQVSAKNAVLLLPNGSCSGRIVTDVVIDFFAAKKRPRPREERCGPPPVQKALALADEFRQRLDGGDVNQSGLARLHGLTRARVTQILNLLTLHPRILDFLRTLPPGPRARLYTERRMRPLLRLEPPGQLRTARALLPDFAPLNASGKTDGE
jgi:hypothetical protein